MFVFNSGVASDMRFARKKARTNSTICARARHSSHQGVAVDDLVTYFCDRNHRAAQLHFQCERVVYRRNEGRGEFCRVSLSLVP